MLRVSLCQCPTLPLLVAIVTVPVTARVFTVIEPVSSTLNNPPATVIVPVDEMVRLATVAEPVVPSTVNLPFDAVRVPVTVAEPVVVNVVTVVEPAFIVP